MDRFPAIATALLTLSFVLSPLVTEPFSGFRAEQLPIPQVRPPVQPAGYAFAIWGVLYVWLVVSAAFGLWKRPHAADWDHVRWPLMISMAAGTPWLWLATRSAIGAALLIFAMLIPAVIALLRAPHRDRLWLRTPIALYAGWVSAAACVSLATVSAGYGVGFGAVFWAVVGVLLAFGIARWTQSRRPDTPEYTAAVVWALCGIVVANGTTQPLVAGLAGAGIIALVLLWWTDRHPAKG